MTQIGTKSHWLRNITIIIIIALLIWEYALPMANPDIMTPSEYITESLFNNDFDDSVWSMTLINQTTGQNYIFSGYMFYVQNMTQYHTYSLGILTEGLPVNVLDTLTWRVEIQYWNTSIDDWSLGGLFAFKISGYEILFKDSWFIPEDSLFINYEMTYSITMTLLDYNGYSIPVKNTPYTSQTLRLDDYLLSCPAP